MIDVNKTPDAIDKTETAQRSVARMAEQDAELVAAMALAYAAGREAGEARAKKNEQ